MPRPFLTSEATAFAFFNGMGCGEPLRPLDPETAAVARKVDAELAILFPVRKPLSERALTLRAARQNIAAARKADTAHGKAMWLNYAASTRRSAAQMAVAA